MRIFCVITACAQSSDPFAPDYAEQGAIIGRLDEQIKILEAKANFLARLKELDSFTVSLLDPASIELDITPASSVKVEDTNNINRLRLALCEVVSKPQEAPFCFYPITA